MNVGTREWDRVETAEDFPKSWRFTFDDGADGCMPCGWYAEGLDAAGFPVVWPVRHEYGPFETRGEAEIYVREVSESTIRALTDGKGVGKIKA